MNFGRLTGHAEGAITVGGHRADEHEGSHQCQRFFHAPAFRLTSSTTRSNAACSPSITFPPAWAISGRPPPDPPISTAAGLMSSFAGNRWQTSDVLATRNETLPSLTEPNPKVPDPYLSRNES